ncbi:hypothetical protein NIE88_07960 [Sporolactobacillus shoreicorticis]|uniref:Uncharacterized protein n=1 Tax=Sporolactobacillus shoreicorticis TaxID=1923877 RepID=A0ABW5S5X5_9BACL|nr:hypothetical protein [Sporolactobacillus shoreicorticis]MCO7125703.1 hypothetical protein [Sporolactobacillus shoreicorticis]
MSNILCLFRPSLSVELLLTELQRNKIKKSDISCFILKAQTPFKNGLTDKDPTETTSLADLGFIFATVFGVVGASIGFRLTLGPIIWGIVSSIIGFLLGFIIDYFFTRAYKQKSHSFVLISICCRSEQETLIKKIAETHQVLGLTVIES